MKFDPNQKMTIGARRTLLQLREMLETMQRMPGIKIAVWWHGCDLDSQKNVARPYYIDDVDGLTDLFRDYFATLKQ